MAPPVLQTSYTVRRGIAFPGMLGDAFMTEGLSRVNGEASLAIPFGVAVVQKNTTIRPAEAMLLPRQAAFTTQAWLGVTIHEHNETGDTPVGEMISICRKGRIWVICETAVTAAQVLLPGQVKIRLAAADSQTQLGGFRSTASGTPASVATLTGVRFCTPCDAGGLTLLEISDSVTATADA